MSYSTAEFVLGGDWLRAFHTAYLDRSSLFVRRRHAAEPVALPIDGLLKSQAAPMPASVCAELIRPLIMEPRKAAQQIATTNQLIGRYFKHRYGYRDQPLLVVSRAFPWATFFSPISDARTYFEGALRQLFEYVKKERLPSDAFVAALILVIIVNHPFVDCNGRTARMVLFGLLRATLRLSDDDAFRYAELFSGANSSFILALWEIREQGNYNYYMDLLA